MYSDYVNRLEETYITIKENTESLVAAIKECRLELIVDKSTYMVMSQYQNAGRSHNRKIDNICFERVKYFK